MAASVPLRSTVRIDLESGSAAGQRRYRLSESIELPPRILLTGDLPIEGIGRGVVHLGLPDGAMLTARGKLYYDPAVPNKGSQIELLDLDDEQLAALRDYVEQRMES